MQDILQSYCKKVEEVIVSSQNDGLHKNNVAERSKYSMLPERRIEQERQEYFHNVSEY